MTRIQKIEETAFIDKTKYIIVGIHLGGNLGVVVVIYHVTRAGANDGRCIPHEMEIACRTVPLRVLPGSLVQNDHVVGNFDHHVEVHIRHVVRVDMADRMVGVYPDIC